MATKNIDALHEAQADAAVIKLRGEIADAKAGLKVLERQLVIAEEMAADAKVES